MASKNTNEKLIVIYDTHCGWCYGAAPVFDAIVESNDNVEVIHRHLFEGNSAPKMSQGKGAQILQTIPHIEALTGQKFSSAFKENIAQSETEVLRSDLSAQAAALVHEHGPKREFAVRKRIEDLHFKHGVSSNNRQAVIDALMAEGISKSEAERIGSSELQSKSAKQALKGRALMDAVGSRGVPTVLKLKDGQVTQLDHQTFYGRPEAVRNGLAAVSKH